MRGMPLAELFVCWDGCLRLPTNTGTRRKYVDPEDPMAPEYSTHPCGND